ncbi:antibiotic biosynthesis monooxygenase [Pelagibius litoralis]|uniref:Antibiotic biosynthesis monooxygenase n=1 Tax=Pelagibius litoralis TaxID=374515 RepID=A0A967EWY6_9PROT|nr:putative quinol monooxygenase [Pelagibius litoralis]NIA68958.1 antibiotic biosynthesis monooxygenase [Pelagibius litoralis]
MPETFSLFARIVPKPEHLEDARQAIQEIIPATRREAGCREFVLHEARDGAGHLFLYETWDDDAALEAHYAQPYTLSVFERYRDWLAEPVQITKLTRL